MRTNPIRPVATPTDAAIVHLKELSLGFSPQAWPFATTRRSEIDAYFAELRRERPALWNGRVLLLRQHRIDAGVLEGSFLETDYASFLAWRDWGFPEAGVANCFSMGALRGSDGAYLLGVMGAHTAGAGRIYFPAGTPETHDVVDGSVDLLGNLWRELAEETGLAREDVQAEEGWYGVLCGPRIALMKVLRAGEPAAALRQRIVTYLQREREPELSDIFIAKSLADLDPRMPPFVTAFLVHMWK